MKETSFSSDQGNVSKLKDHKEVVRDAKLDMVTPDPNDDSLYADILEEESQKIDLIKKYEQENEEIPGADNSDISPEAIKAIQNIPDHEEVIQDAELDMAAPDPNDDPLYADYVEEISKKGDVIKEYEKSLETEGKEEKKD